MVTRRTVERRLFLLPDADAERINQHFGFTLGLALQQHGQKLHASLVMSNHHHTSVTDVRATLPAFKNQLHAFVARGVNTIRGRQDVFWSGDPPCDVQLLDDEAVLDNMVYIVTNPVKAGLVKWSHQWPGFTTYGWQFGAVRTFERPDDFYDVGNPDVPNKVEVTSDRPDIYPGLADDELYDLFMEKVRAKELEYHAEWRKRGRRFMGLKKLQRQQWNRAAVSWEQRFTITPKVSASNKWLRIAQLQRNREWERAYARARAGHRAGRDVIFPHGTYWMRYFIGVKVATAPP